MKITFLMHQMITGGIEKSLIQLLDKLSKFPKYKFAIIVEKPLKEKIFIDFLNKLETFKISLYVSMTMYLLSPIAAICGQY